MHSAAPLEIVDFQRIYDHSLNTLPDTQQKAYILAYLANLHACKVVVEPNYFDRDYLSEFSAFYSLSARGYPNICKRLHFFSCDDLDRDLLSRAASSDEGAINYLNENYLGFTVIRPLPATPFGRTVLKWFTDDNNEFPRITAPSRIYESHIAGISLKVRGLAWQQQDSGVAACATVGIWTMLHSSAFDDVHAIPTTAAITKAAHKSIAYGQRMFPSSGLTQEQLLAAIQAHGFAPVLLTGDLNNGYFSSRRLGATCSSFLRSGYPVLIIGQHNSENTTMGHAVCAVGFREPEQQPIVPDEVDLFDSATDIVYIHDDNIGPNVRFRVSTKNDINGREGACFSHEAPEYLAEEHRDVVSYPDFFPTSIIVAVHEDLRISPDNLHLAGQQLTHQICQVLNQVLEDNGLPRTGLLFTTRFFKLADYFSQETRIILGHTPDLLAEVRLSLAESVPPMSLHIGVVRVALPDSSVLMDILYDTTDTDRNRPVYAHVIYDSNVEAMLAPIEPATRLQVLGIPVKAY